MDRLLGPARIAVDDDVLIEIAVRLERIGQAGADQENAEQAKSGEPQQRQDQHRKQAGQEDRQQGQQNDGIGLARTHGKSLTG